MTLLIAAYKTYAMYKSYPLILNCLCLNIYILYYLSSLMGVIRLDTLTCNAFGVWHPGEMYFCIA